MAKLDILWVPDPILKTKCAPVMVIDDALRVFLDDMLDTMYAAPGIGLAAPQVGRAERFLVLDVSDDKSAPLKLINPEIVDVADEDAVYEEGCLSIPEHYAEVTRPAWVKVAYTDETGAAREITADGLLAVCLQHEMDHLDGIVFLDHLSAGAGARTRRRPGSDGAHPDQPQNRRGTGRLRRPRPRRGGGRRLWPDLAAGDFGGTAPRLSERSRFAVATLAWGGADPAGDRRRRRRDRRQFDGHGGGLRHPAGAVLAAGRP